jgi:hypothetical protein
MREAAHGTGHEQGCHNRFFHHCLLPVVENKCPTSYRAEPIRAALSPQWCKFTPAVSLLRIEQRNLLSAATQFAILPPSVISRRHASMLYSSLIEAYSNQVVSLRFERIDAAIKRLKRAVQKTAKNNRA